MSEDKARIVGRDLSPGARALAEANGWTLWSRMHPKTAREYEQLAAQLASGGLAPEEGEQPVSDPVSTFIEARVAEEEERAKEAIIATRPGTHWHWVDPQTDKPAVPHGEYLGPSMAVSLRTIEEFQTESLVGDLPGFVLWSVDEVPVGAGEHIAHWDPARVLKECRSKREILRQHTVSARTLASGDELPACRACRYGDLPHPWPCPTIRALASNWDDHPDFRLLEEFKVSPMF